MLRRTWSCLLALGLLAGVAEAQELEFGGQVRPRAEFRSPDWFRTDGAVAFTSMRARVHLAAALGPGVVPGDAWTGDDVQSWLYLMMDVTF